MRWVGAAACAVALGLAGCGGARVGEDAARGAATAAEGETMNGATSPSGERHPGEIEFDDRVAGRVWREAAADNPPTVAWVDVGGRWVAVTRVEITGVPGQRRITMFGADGTMLESTVQAPRPTSDEPPTPVPTPSE